MKLGGYANHIGRVNLSNSKVAYETIPEDWARKYVGARGLGVRYCLEAGPTVEALGPDNLLCFMNGPLTGTRVNMSGRLSVVSKSPLTGGITDSHMGGWSAARLRWAGFDGLLFSGQAEKPVYAYVENGTVELRDASEVWGKGVHETVKFFQNRYGKKDLSVMTIGQAGENKVRFAGWINEDDRAAGRGGTGAVGGSKNLKAIVIKAESDMPKPTDAAAFKTAHDEALAHIMDERVITAPRKGVLSVYGTNVLMNIAEEIGALPTGNSQETGFGAERAEKTGGEYVKEHILVNDPTCHACPVACKKEVEVEYQGERVHMESYEYESAWAFGANCRNDNTASVAKLIDQANDYGLDTIELGNVFSMYMEATELAIAGNGTLDWGDHAAMVALVEKVAMREGIGDVLAEGAANAAAHFGNPDIAMSVKGQAIPAYDPRGVKGMGLGYATSNRGACHLRAYTPAAEVIGNTLGPMEETVDRLAWEGKAELVITFQHVHTMTDCLDLCKFSTFSESLDDFAAQYSAITGAPMDVAGLLEIGERVYNLERYYNNQAGLGAGSDYLPKRFTDEPSNKPGSEGHVCELDKMLPEYYEQRGWENGVVPEAKLKELGIL